MSAFLPKLDAAYAVFKNEESAIDLAKAAVETAKQALEGAKVALEAAKTQLTGVKADLDVVIEEGTGLGHTKAKLMQIAEVRYAAAAELGFFTAPAAKSVETKAPREKRSPAATPAVAAPAPVTATVTVVAEDKVETETEAEVVVETKSEVKAADADYKKVDPILAAHRASREQSAATQQEVVTEVVAEVEPVTESVVEAEHADAEDAAEVELAEESAAALVEDQTEDVDADDAHEPIEAGAGEDDPHPEIVPEAAAGAPATPPKAVNFGMPSFLKNK